MNSVIRNAAIALLAGLSLGAARAEAPLVAGKPIVIPGGPGKFDYVVLDEGMHRAFATHGGTKTLAVLDTRDGHVLPSVEIGVGHGVAVDAADNKVFVGCSENNVAVLNRRTLTKIGEIATTGPVDGIAYDPQNGKLYADHDDGKDVWVIDAKTDKVVGTIAVSGAPEYIDRDTKTGKIYQNIKDNNTVQVINTSLNTVETSWSTGEATSPHGLAIDSATGRLFSAGKNGKLVVIDVKSGKVISTVEIARGVDQISIDIANRRIYCACPNAITVVQETEDGAKSIGDVPAAASIHTINVDPKTHTVYTVFFDKENSYFQVYTTK